VWENNTYPLGSKRRVMELILPPGGGLVRLFGPGYHGKAALSLVEEIVARSLCEGIPIHWVDGASRIDPSRMLKTISKCGGEGRDCLIRLYVSRGFTLHQLAAQVQRLSGEIKLTGSKLIVIDGLLAMHGDDQINAAESRSILRRSLHKLQELATLGVTVLLVTADHGQGLDYLTRRCILSLDVRDYTNPRLLHQSTLHNRLPGAAKQPIA